MLHGEKILKKEEKEKIGVMIDFLESFDTLLTKFSSRQEKIAENCLLAPESNDFWNTIIKVLPVVESELVLARLLHEKIREQHILLNELKGID